MKSFEKGLWRNEEKELTCTTAGNNKRELQDEKEKEDQKELQELTGTEAGNYSRVDIEENESTTREN